MFPKSTDPTLRGAFSTPLFKPLCLALASLLLLAALPPGFAQSILGTCPPGTSCPSGGGLGTPTVGTPTAGGTCPAPSDGGLPTNCDGDGAASLGPSGPEEGVGNPINLITGNKFQKETDLSALPGVLGLEIVRYYNSKYARDYAPNILGRGWKLSYETVLYVRPGALHIVQADGKRISFDRDPKNPSLCSTFDPSRGHVLVHRTGRREETYTWVWTHGANAGRRLEFDSRGRLTRIVAPGGEVVSLQYNPKGHLTQVTDPQGRSLRLNYPEQPAPGDPRQPNSGPNRFTGLMSIDSPVGRYTYTYGDATGGHALSPLPGLTAFQPPSSEEAAAPKPAPLTARQQAHKNKQQARKHQRLSNLVRVGWPNSPTETNAPSRLYHYENPHYPGLLTGISQQGPEGAAQRLSRYRYDAQGYAIESELTAGEHVRLSARTRNLPPPEAPDTPVRPGQTVLEDAAGQKTTYAHTILGRENRLLESRGAG